MAVTWERCSHRVFWYSDASLQEAVSRPDLLSSRLFVDDILIRAIRQLQYKIFDYGFYIFFDRLLWNEGI